MHRIAIVLVVLFAFALGCSKKNPFEGFSETGNLFIIGDQDFGIDADACSVEIDTSDPNNPLLTIEIRGSEERLEKFLEDENSLWRLASQAPHFYIRDFPLDSHRSTGTSRTTYSLEEDGEHACAIAMIDQDDSTRGDLDEVEIEVAADKSIQVSGRLFIWQQDYDFAIRWSK